MRAVQERVMQFRSGQVVGPCILFFGARYEKYEYLYQQELEDLAIFLWN